MLDVEQGYVIEQREAFFCSRWIAGAGLVKHKLACDAIVVAPLVGPPFLR
jgi:hypothetical protein